VYCNDSRVAIEDGFVDGMAEKLLNMERAGKRQRRVAFNPAKQGEVRWRVPYALN